MISEFKVKSRGHISPQLKKVLKAIQIIQKKNHDAKNGNIRKRKRRQQIVKKSPNNEHSDRTPFTTKLLLQNRLDESHM